MIIRFTKNQNFVNLFSDLRMSLKFMFGAKTGLKNDITEIIVEKLNKVLPSLDLK